MELFQRTLNPWGQSVLVRISWDLFWAALLVGALFVIGHLVIRARARGRSAAPAVAVTPAGVPARVVRHSLTSRLFHWVMALSMLVLLGTGFLPQVGLQFAWVEIHWITGVVLIAAILFHMVHATFFQSLRNIWISFGDVREWMQEMRHHRGKGPPPRKPGKYPLDHKLFHHAVLVTGFGAMITGVLMMFRIETPLLARNPYLYSDATWGVIYVIHGLSSVGLVGLTIAHIYFAILPEKRWLTLSMIFGWISREKYAAHHDLERWKPAAAEPEPAPAPKGVSVEAS
jgi:cytochrome b subunit of formate dehydrogenase